MTQSPLQANLFVADAPTEAAEARYASLSHHPWPQMQARKAPNDNRSN